MNNEKKKKSCLMKCSSFIDKNGALVGSVLCPNLISIITSQKDFFEEYTIYLLPYTIHCLFWFWFWICVCVIFTIICTFKLYNNTKDINKRNAELEDKIKKLKDENEAINILKCDFQKLHRDYVDMMLININESFNLTATERISLYCEKSGTFNILGRYSKNPKFNNINRQKFLQNKGALSQAWEQGSFSDFNCPNFIIKKNSKNKKYYNYQFNKYGYKEVQTKNRTMKSSCYIGKAITKNNKNIGVILYESENKDILPKINDDVISTIDKKNDLLVNLIESGLKYYNIIIPIESGKIESEVMNRLGDSNEQTT